MGRRKCGHIQRHSPRIPIPGSRALLDALASLRSKLE